MEPDKVLIEKLCERFGQAAVKVHTPHHIQILLPSFVHNIWITQLGQFVYQLAGMRKSRTAGQGKAGIGNLLAELDRYNYDITDQARMNDTLRFTSFINDCLKINEPTPIKIFTDAGWKNGNARIAAVLLTPNAIKAEQKNIQADSIQDAERQAIELGLTLHDTCPVYNDNSSASAMFSDNSRVKWIDRKRNKPSDKLANLRNSTSW